MGKSLKWGKGKREKEREGKKEREQSVQTFYKMGSPLAYDLKEAVASAKFKRDIKKVHELVECVGMGG